jgi:hypothetical protein
MGPVGRKVKFCVRLINDAQRHEDISNKKTSYVAFSPQGNYTNVEAAAGQRSQCQRLRIEGCRVVSATIDVDCRYFLG